MLATNGMTGVSSNRDGFTSVCDFNGDSAASGCQFEMNSSKTFQTNINWVISGLAESG